MNNTYLDEEYKEVSSDLFVFECENIYSLSKVFEHMELFSSLLSKIVMKFKMSAFLMTIALVKQLLQDYKLL